MNRETASRSLSVVTEIDNLKHDQKIGHRSNFLIEQPCLFWLSFFDSVGNAAWRWRKPVFPEFCVAMAHRSSLQSIRSHPFLCASFA
jgi:hypothetical protein